MLNHALVNDAYCQGVNFDVLDVDALADALALVLIQEYSLAKALVFGSSLPAQIILSSDDVEDIINRRLKPVDIYHRDGFLFQLMMWLAAHLDLHADDIIALPHSQGSAKGQDSLVVHRAAGAVVAISICEDKATETPRKTIRKEVWPEIATYEAGGRRDELRSNVIATLGTAGISSEEAIALIRGIAWEGRRKYRVRVTVETHRAQNLFKGFDTVVAGTHEMRRGETVLLPDMRNWMTGLAARIETRLRTFGR